MSSLAPPRGAACLWWKFQSCVINLSLTSKSTFESIYALYSHLDKGLTQSELLQTKHHLLLARTWRKHRWNIGVGICWIIEKGCSYLKEKWSGPNTVMRFCHNWRFVNFTNIYWSKFDCIKMYIQLCQYHETNKIIYIYMLFNNIFQYVASSWYPWYHPLWIYKIICLCQNCVVNFNKC